MKVNNCMLIMCFDPYCLFYIMVRDVEKRVILGMQPPTCDNMEIDVGKYDVKSNVDDEMDCVVY